MPQKKHYFTEIYTNLYYLIGLKYLLMIWHLMTCCTKDFSLDMMRFKYGGSKTKPSRPTIKHHRHFQNLSSTDKNSEILETFQKYALHKQNMKRVWIFKPFFIEQKSSPYMI